MTCFVPFQLLLFFSIHSFVLTTMCYLFIPPLLPISFHHHLIIFSTGPFCQSLFTFHHLTSCFSFLVLPAISPISFPLSTLPSSFFSLLGYSFPPPPSPLVDRWLICHHHKQPHPIFLFSLNLPNKSRLPCGCYRYTVLHGHFPHCNATFARFTARKTSTFTKKYYLFAGRILSTIP